MSRLVRESLIDAMHAAGRPREKFLVGGEFERHLLDQEGRPLPYGGEPGIAWLLGSLQSKSWEPYREGDNLVALLRKGASVTLEPGCQFELSGAPFRTVREVHDEAAAFRAEVAEVLAPTAFRQVHLGFTPQVSIPSIGWVPKARYVLMREHLGATGKLAHHMMKGTCATQASYDFIDEADCARKVRITTALGPLTTALFANSPYAEGKASGYRSFRGHIWTQTDPARCGLPNAAENFSFDAWIDYLLETPMMFWLRDGRWCDPKGTTFADWLEMEDGPTWSDWELHLTSVFPEVRVKTSIEIRGADCVDPDMATAFVALFFGMLYDEEALAAAEALAGSFASYGTKDERFDVACRDGLEGKVGPNRLAEWGERLVTAAMGGLERVSPGDASLLLPLARQVEKGHSPARDLLNEFGPEPDLAALLRHTSV